MSGELVFIWSEEHRAYWRPDGCGYTNRVSRAGVYTREDAEARTSHCGPEKQIVLEPLTFTLTGAADPWNTRAPTEPHPIPVTEEQSRVLNEALFASFDSVEPPHPIWQDMDAHDTTAPVLVWYEWPDGTRITDKAEIDRHGRWVGSEGLIEPQGWQPFPEPPEGA